MKFIIWSMEVINCKLDEQCSQFVSFHHSMTYTYSVIIITLKNAM